MAPLYRIGDATFDPGLARLERDGQAVELQPKPCAVLQVLLANRDRIVTREELLRAVWPGVVVSESSLTRAISLLRTALGECASRPNVIATQSRRGYRLVGPVELLPERAEAGRGDPFVGRDSQLAELERAWSAARGGRGAIALVSGEAGIGKTRLATELVARVRAAGGRALVGFCPSPGGVPPLWPWARALRGIADAEGPGALERVAARARVELADLLHDHAGGGATARVVDSAPAHFGLLDSLERLLGALAAEQPLLVVLDDLHWADRSSLRALEHVARGVGLQRLLVVTTFREGEVEASHPLYAALASLTRGCEDLRLRLGPLDEPSAERLVTALAERALPSDVARAIRTRSSGNPLFLRELVRAWTHDGVAPAPGGPMPPGIRDLLSVRIARQPATLRAVLQVGALLGSELELELLRELVDVDAAELAETLALALDGGWLRLVSRAPTRYSFAHPLVRDASAASLPASERVALHARAAAALARSWGADLDAVQERLAEHHLEMARGGHPDARAAHHAGRAAELAERRLAFDEAERWFERALEALELEKDADESLRGEYLVGAARMRFAVGERLGARAPAEAAASLARRRGDGRLLASAALVFWVRGASQPERHPQGLALLEEASRAVGHSAPALRAELLARTAEYVSLEPDKAARTAALCEESLQLARDAGNPRTLYTVLYCMLFAVWAQLSPSRRRKLSDELMEISTGLDDPSAPIQASALHLTCLLEAGDIAAVDAEIARFERAIERLEVPSFFRWYSPLYRAMRATMSGRLADGERLAQQAFEHARHANVYDAKLAVSTQLLQIRADQGRGQELAGPIAEMVQLYPYDLSYTPLHAIVTAEAGDRAGARAIFEPFFDAYDPRADVNRNITAMLCTGLCEQLGDAPRARTIYERTLGDADLMCVNLSAWVFLGSLHWPLGNLAALCGDVAAAKRHFLEAVRRNEKVGACTYVARCHYDHGRLCAANGELGDARELARAALAIAREIGMDRLRQDCESLLTKLGSARAG